MKQKGFTLLEILLVIAAIGILAAIVIVAINPNRQLAQTRNAERKSELNAIYKAIGQYSIDNSGEYPGAISGYTSDQSIEICAQGVSELDCTSAGLLFLGDLVPTYIAAIPADPQASGNETNYQLNYIHTGGLIGLNAEGSELEENITVGQSIPENTYGQDISTPGEDCQDILSNNPSSTGVNGTYWIQPGSLGSPFQATCDMVTDGGGWTLVLNYVRSSGTPLIDIRTTNLPIQNSTTLGDNEVGLSSWGHAGNALLSEFTISELRFYGVKSNHSRVIHFKTSLSNCISYFRSGIGSCANLYNNFTTLSGHSANIPGTATSNYSNQGNRAMTEFPFYQNGADHWGVGAAGGARWEADDYRNTSSASIHQIWVK